MDRKTKDQNRPAKPRARKYRTFLVRIVLVTPNGLVFRRGGREHTIEARHIVGYLDCGTYWLLKLQLWKVLELGLTFRIAVVISREVPGDDVNTPLQLTASTPRPAVVVQDNQPAAGYALVAQRTGQTAQPCPVPHMVTSASDSGPPRLPLRLDRRR